MHGLKSAIWAILQEIGRLAGLACPLSAALHFRPYKMTGNEWLYQLLPIKYELKLPSEARPTSFAFHNQK